MGVKKENVKRRKEKIKNTLFGLIDRVLLFLFREGKGKLAATPKVEATKDRITMFYKQLNTLDYLIVNITRVGDECINLEFKSQRLDTLTEMKSDFEKLQNCAHAVGMKMVESEDVINWVSKVISLAKDVEDVMVDYNLLVLRRNQISSSTTCIHIVQKFLGKVTDTISSTILEIPSSSRHSWSTLTAKFQPATLPGPSNPLSHLRERLLLSIRWKLMVPYLAKIKRAETKLIIREASCYGLNPETTTEQTYQLSRSSTQDVLRATSIVGREDEVQKIEKYLMKKKRKMVVICLTGEAGIGKTTVAAAVYKRVKQSFNYHAWVSTSQNSQAIILEDMITSLSDSLSIMTPENLKALPIPKLKEHIRLLLDGKQFLLFLDDLQNPNDWEDIQDALPVGCEGKILVTTRESTTVQIPDKGFQLKLKKLTSSQSLQLLRQRALLHSDSGSWPSVQSLAANIVEVCDGLPLAISLIGGMLSEKSSKSKWRTVDQMLKEVDFITCCYAELQPVLKSCFLYCSLFPSQYEISCKRLIRLWIAEGLIENKGGGRTVEETATYQLYELIKRGMIQVGKVGPDGEIKTCQLLPVMQELAQKQYEIGRLQTLLDFGESSFGKSDRLSLHHSDGTRSGNTIVKVFPFLGFARTDAHIITSNCTYKLLLVLELQHLPIENLPKAVEDLELLRYLGLRGTKLKTLPPYLKKLGRLLTLDIRDTWISVMRTGLNKWKKLRHFLLASSFENKVVDLSDADIECFQDLQTLAGVKITQRIAEKIRHLCQLKKLSAGMITTRISFSLLESIQHLKSLQSLTIKCAWGQTIDFKPQLLPKHLEKLRVGGQVKNLTAAAINLQSLKFLYVWDCPTIEDLLQCLGNLRNLVVLSLCNAYEGEMISFGGSYPQLKKLSILHLKNLKRCGEIMPGCMPKLESLTIGYCLRLKNPPEGLKNLTSIQELQLASMPADFVNEVRDFHSKQKKLKFSLKLRGMADEVPTPITVSFPSYLPPYDFSRPQATSGLMEN